MEAILDPQQRTQIQRDYAAALANNYAGGMTFLVIGEEESLDRSYPLQVVAHNAEEAVDVASRIVGYDMAVVLEIPAVLHTPVAFYTGHGVSGHVASLQDYVI